MRKVYIIYILEIRFILLDKRNELMLLAFMGYVVKSIEESIIYIV